MPRIPRPSGKAPTGDANVSDSLRPAAMHEVVKGRGCVGVAVHDYADWRNTSGNCGNSRGARAAQDRLYGLARTGGDTAPAMASLRAATHILRRAQGRG